jgi:hypothetical protein
VSLVEQDLLTPPEHRSSPRGNQNPYIEKEQTTQWSKEKVQKDQQRSTKHTYKTEDRVTRTPLKPGRVSSSCSTSGTRRVNLTLRQKRLFQFSHYELSLYM